MDVRISMGIKSAPSGVIYKPMKKELKNQGTLCLLTGLNRQFRGSVIFDDLSPTHGELPMTPLINIPKGISSKMGLEVA